MPDATTDIDLSPCDLRVQARDVGGRHVVYPAQDDDVVEAALTGAPTGCFVGRGEEYLVYVRDIATVAVGIALPASYPEAPATRNDNPVGAVLVDATAQMSRPGMAWNRSCAACDVHRLLVTWTGTGDAGRACVSRIHGDAVLPGALRLRVDHQPTTADGPVDLELCGLLLRIGASPGRIVHELIWRSGRWLGTERVPSATVAAIAGGHRPRRTVSAGPVAAAFGEDGAVVEALRVGIGEGQQAAGVAARLEVAWSTVSRVERAWNATILTPRRFEAAL